MSSITGNQGTVSSIQTSEGFAITPSDSVILKKDSSDIIKRPFVVFNNSTDAAIVKVDTYYGDTLTYTVSAGSILGVGMQVSKVYATGTTITSGNLIAQR